MKDKTVQPPQDKVPCESCGGSGQIGYFGGVSRFITSWEECWECAGTGYQNRKDENDQKDQN